MHFRTLARLLGTLLLLESVTMVLCGVFAIVQTVGEDGGAAKALFLSSAITALAGGILILSTVKHKITRVSRREGLSVVGIGWILAGLFGAFPFYLTALLNDNLMLDISSCIFESVSGFTTTGATVLPDIEAWPPAILMWRSVSQWLGGLGILVLFVAVFSYLGMGSKSLFRNESSFQTGEASTARIKDTANSILKVYLLVTAVCCIGLIAMGMDVFDAFCNTFATVSTGGFSPKNASIGHYEYLPNSALIEVWISLFMIICSISFLVWVMISKKNWKRLHVEEEGKFFIIMCLFAAFAMAFGVMKSEGISYIEALRDTWFTAVSIASTSGFGTANFEEWPSYCEVIILSLMFIGGAAGSTSGGLKVNRIFTLWRTARYEIVKSFRPNKVSSVQVNGVSLRPESRSQTVIFIALYLFIAIASIVVVSLLEFVNDIDLETSLTAVTSAIFNIGPGFGDVGPTENFSHFLPITKLYFCFLMIIGRLELFAILVLLIPSFWKRY